MRGGFALHCRARRVYWVLAALLILSAVSWYAAASLAGHPELGGFPARAPVVVGAPLLAAVLVSATLTGPEPELDRTSARLGHAWRAGHACLAMTVPALLLAAAVPGQPFEWGAAVMVRNVAGLVGVVLLTAEWLPTTPSWAPGFGYTAVCYLAAPKTPRAGSDVWAWPMQPGGPDASWVMAAGIASAGITVYVLGNRRQSTSESL